MNKTSFRNTKMSTPSSQYTNPNDVPSNKKNERDFHWAYTHDDDGKPFLYPLSARFQPPEHPFVERRRKYIQHCERNGLIPDPEIVRFDLFDE